MHNNPLTQLVKTIRVGLLTSTMGYTCVHAFRHQVIPLYVNDFDQHWWLVQPIPIHEDKVAMRMKLERRLRGWQLST